MEKKQRRRPMGGKKPREPATFSGGLAGSADAINGRGVPQTHIKGVHWHVGRGGWIAQIWHDGKMYDAGTHDTPEEAAEARAWMINYLKETGVIS